MRIRQYSALALVLLFSMLIVTTCKKDPGTGPDEPGSNGTSSERVINSSGGKVEDSYGASITVPAGAVSSSLTISVRTIHADSIPSGLQSTMVGNMIECLPHGTTFLQPVTIILPVTSGVTYQAGDTANLHIFNPDSSAWELTTIPAVVTADGQHLQALVSHFTSYGTNSPGSFVGNGNGRDFDNIHNYADLSNAAYGWSRDFREKFGHLGTKKRIGDCCFSLANMQIVFRFSSPAYTETYTDAYGEPASCDKTENLHFNEGTPSDGYHMDISVTSCWTVCGPDMWLSADPDKFYVPEDAGQTSTITATIRCGDGPGAAVSGQSVKFVVSNGPGQVDPPLTKTNSQGVASGMYTVDTRGIATVRAEIQTCASLKPMLVYCTDNILIDTLIPDHIYAKVIINHQGENMPWTFRDTVEMVLIITVDDDSVTIKGGEGSHQVSCTATDEPCSIINLTAPAFTPTGTITRNGNALDVAFNPNLAYINFNYYCSFGDDNILNTPYPGYSNLVSSLIAMKVKGTILMENGSYTQGSGSESFGEDMPLTYEYEIVYGAKTHP